MAEPLTAADDRRPSVQQPSSPASASDVAATTPAVGRTVVRTPGPAEQQPNRHRRRTRVAEALLGWAVPLGVLALWELAASARWIDVRFFSRPSAVVERGWELLRAGTLVAPVRHTLVTLLVGLAIGATVGVLIGALTGMSRWVRAALEPTLSALYTVPKLAIFPILLVVFGLNARPKIALVAISVFFFVWLQTMSGFLAVAEGYVEAAASFGATRMQRFRHVLLPAAGPQIFVGLRLATGVAILVAVGAEFVNGNEGIGRMIWQSWNLLLVAQMYVGVVVVSLMGVVLMGAVKAAGRLVLPWDRSAGASR